MDCTYTKNRILDIEISERIRKLKEKVLAEPRYISTEQACIITDVYQENEDVSVPLKRALSFAASVDNIEIKIYPEEDIVGNRTAGSKAGVIFPESGTAWLREELDTLETRDQDVYKRQMQRIPLFLPYGRLFLIAVVIRFGLFGPWHGSLLLRRYWRLLRRRHGAHRLLHIRLLLVNRRPDGLWMLRTVFFHQEAYKLYDQENNHSENRD